MKRKSKILALCLSALLIFSAFAVMAPASADEAVVGVTTETLEEFKYITTAWSGTASNGENYKAGNVSFIIGDRSGSVEAVSSLPYEDNKYVVYTQEDKVGTTMPYMYAMVGSYPTVDTLNNNADDLSKFSYFSLDMDVMSPTGKFVQGSGISLSARRITTSGGKDFWNNTALSNIAVLGNDTTGSYVYMGSNSSNKKYVDPYEFTHITCIIETVVTSSSYSVNSYLYVNGEFISKKVGSTSTTTYYNNVPHASMYEYRFNFATTEDSTQTVAVDNCNFRSFSKSYNGNLSTVLSSQTMLDAWESNIYDASTIPAGYMEAVNETQGKYYHTAAEAVAAANEGDMVTIVKDQTSPVTIDKLISVKTLMADGTDTQVTLTPADGFSLYERMKGVWTVEPTSLKVYGYTSGGVDLTAGREMSFADIIAAADAGSTIYLYEDAYINSTENISLKKNLTIDLSGKAAYISTAYKTYFMSPTKTLNIKNGTLVAEYGPEAERPGKSYVLFSLSASSVLNLENVNTYTGMLAWNFSANNPKVNIKGGEHYITIPSTDTIAGFVEARANITFTANDATFYCGSYGGGLFTSQHYRGSSSVTKKSTFTYNNCTIIGGSPQTNLIKYSNEFTDIIFNDCDIFGSITPTLYSWDASADIGVPNEGDIIIGKGCRISSNAEFSSAVVLEDSCGIFNINDIEKYNFKFNTGSLGNSDFGFVSNEADVIFGCKIDAASSYTVTWYKEDGKSVIKTETVAPGGVVTPPAYAHSSSSGWFDAEYSGWAKSLTGEKTTDFTINRDTKFYPAIVEGTVVPSLSGAKYNLSFIGSIGVNFYLPTTVDGVTLNGVYAENGDQIFPERVYSKGTKLDLYKLGSVAATSLSDGITLTVDYTVMGVTDVKTLTLSPLAYASALLADSDDGKFAYHSSAYPLVYDMVRYSNNLIKYVNYVKSGVSGEDSDLRALLDKYTEFSTELPDNFADTSAIDISDLVGYVSYVTFEVSQYQPSYKIGFKENSGVVECYITLDGYYSAPLAGANSGSVTYKSSSESYYGETKYLSSAYVSNIPMYNADNTVTINVLLDNGIRKSGTYNLNAYYSNVSVADQTQKSLLETFLLSFGAFSDSSEKYRFDSVTITEENAKNFTNCDHTGAIETTLAITDRMIPVTAPAHYCQTCDSYLIYYSDFGVVGDGVSYGLSGAVGTNDFAALREAHSRANAMAAEHPEINIVLVAEGTVGKNFYIGKPDDNGANPILIKTNVDWNGAHFIIDDTTITNKGSDKSYQQAIFLATTDAEVPTLTLTDNMPNGVKEGATNIGYAPGEPLMISLTFKSVRHYIRYGGNVNSGGSQTEMIIVDAYGNVDPTTPIQFDYTNEDFCSILTSYANEYSMIVTKCPPTDENGDGKCDSCGKTIGKAFAATARRISDKPILINGLDAEGNINCKWETITNDDVDVSSYDQFVRNVKITRSNVTIQGMDRIFVEDNLSFTPRQTYAGFVTVQNAYNTTIKDMLVTHHLGHNIWIDGKDTGVSLGSYEFSGGHSINTSWINCKAKNFFKPGGLVSYRGLFGTNSLRNSYLKNCVLPSFDSHTGAYNVTIEDSTFEHINYIGGGEVVMKNVAVYVNGGYASCILRSDYGSLWKGDIKIDGLTLLHPTDYSREYVDLVRAHYTNHYFGYDAYLPINIYANNVSIVEYERDTDVYTTENGIIVENETRKSSKKLGIFAILNNEFKKDYDYSTVNANNLGPKICTDAIYITNSDVDILYPDHWFFDDMKIYIDGELQDWFVVREGLHTDANGDGICDNGCGQPLG